MCQQAIAPGAATDWTEMLGIQPIGDQMIAAHRLLPLLLVMPDGNYGALGAPAVGQRNAAASFGQAEDYIINEVIPFVDQQYHTQSDWVGG